MKPGYLEDSKFTLKSVGIDIGSTTSSVTFSLLELAKPEGQPRSKYEVIDRTITHRSRIFLTEYLDRFKTINVTTLAEFIKDAYEEAGEDPSKMNTGAVIVTGEAANKTNAEAIANLFSQQAGKFICAMAGPNLESVLSAHGSGAVDRSLSPHKHASIEHMHPIMVMNVDIGGGTSKVALAYGGQILWSAAINVGARIIALDGEGRIERIEEAANIAAKQVGLDDLNYGMVLTADHRRLLSSNLVDALMSLVVPERILTPLAKKLMITETQKDSSIKLDKLIFSGGVSEFIYGNDAKDYGDLGHLFADDILKIITDPNFDIPIERPDEFIRATVIGASQYSIQVSGGTIYLSNEDILPLQNIPVVRLSLTDLPVLDQSVVREKVTHGLKLLDNDPNRSRICAIGIDSQVLGYEGLKVLGLGLKEAYRDILPLNLPIVLVSKHNLGSSLGRILVEDLLVGRDVISIDEVHLSDMDYIDIGSKIPKSGIVPVIVKSLIFKARPGAPFKDFKHTS